MNKVVLFILSIQLSCAFSQTDRYWVATQSGNWSDQNNWSTSSGGSPTGGIPQAGDRVYFDGFGNADCSVDVSVDLKKLEILTGYSSVVQLAGYSCTVGNEGLTIGSGTFDCGGSQVSIEGDLEIASNFIASSYQITAQEDINLITSGSFDHNNGLFVIITNGQTNISGEFVFNGLKIIDLSQVSSTVTTGDSIVVYSELDIETGISTRLNGSVLLVGGDVSFSGVGFVVGTTQFKFNGLGNQRVQSSDAAIIPFQSIAVEKVIGNILCEPSLSISNSLELSSGNIVIGDGSYLFISNGGGVVGGSSQSYIEGEVRKNGSTDFLFPVGSKGNYYPLEVTGLNQTQEIGASAISDFIPNSDSLPQSIAIYDNCLFWKIENITSGTFRPRFFPDIYSSCMNLRSLPDYKILQENAGNWNIDSTVIEGVSIITQQGISVSGHITLGSYVQDECVEGPIYWIGGASSDWNNAANWSHFSGGPGSYGIPCFNNTAIFDGNGNSDCQLSSDVSISKVLILSSYSSEINTNGNSLNIIELFK